MSSNSMAYKITDKNVDVYNENKHELPCFDCLVRATCFSEKQATKRAKYLRYTVGLKTPCPEAISVMDKIDTSKHLVMSIYEMEAMDIDNLFDDALRNYHTQYKQFYLTSFYMFHTVVERTPNYLNKDGDNAYYYLGLMYYHVLNDLDAAIEHFTKAVELDPNDCDSLLNRAFCWEEKGDFRKALNDFKTAKKIGSCELPYDIDEIISRLKFKFQKAKLKKL
jgi:tetratricopeptide (TPR) repeat protein